MPRTRQPPYGQWLREQRLMRCWPGGEMARRLRDAAALVDSRLPDNRCLLVMIYRWENDRSGISARYRTLYCRALGIPVSEFGKPVAHPATVSPPRVEDLDVWRLVNMAREGQGKSWLSEFSDVLPAEALAYLSLEPVASVIRSFAALTVPDLAQTRDYAQALCRALYPPRSGRKAGKLAMVTMLRQELARSNTGRRVHLILDEAVLLRRVGSPDVMARQLDYLAAITADRRSTTIQVAPLGRARAVVTSSFAVLNFTGRDAPDVACRGESHDTASVTGRADEVATLAGAFAALSQSALPPEESADLIRRVAKEAQA